MAQAKARVRARVRAARTALSPKGRAERDAAVVAAVTTLVQDRGWSRVAAYAPMAREPGAVSHQHQHNKEEVPVPCACAGGGRPLRPRQRQ